MGLIEILTGWQEIPDEKVNKGIIKILNKKLSKTKGNEKKVIYIKGNTFKYKIIIPKKHFAEFNGHETGFSYSSTKYYSRKE